MARRQIKRQRRKPVPVTEESSSKPKPEITQYTVKGIEAAALDLMRDAARKRGMKVGPWLSFAIREAAGRPPELSAGQELHELRDQMSKIEERLKELVTSQQEITMVQAASIKELVCAPKP